MMVVGGIEIWLDVVQWVSWAAHVWNSQGFIHALECWVDWSVCGVSLRSLDLRGPSLIMCQPNYVSHSTFLVPLRNRPLLRVVAAEDSLHFSWLTTSNYFRLFLSCVPVCPSQLGQFFSRSRTLSLPTRCPWRQSGAHDLAIINMDNLFHASYIFPHL